MGMEPSNWRGILGLGATDDGAKNGPTLYRQLMKILHPDKRTANGERLAGGSERCNAALDRVQVALEMVKIAPVTMAVPGHCARSGTAHAWGARLPRGKIASIGVSKVGPEKAKHPIRSRVSGVNGGASSRGYDARWCQRRAGLEPQGSIHEHRSR